MHPLELVLPRSGLADLFDRIARRGYRVVGPKLEDGTIVNAELRSAEELPVGWTDEQAPGHYRAVRRPDARVFGFASGLRSFRGFFQRPERVLVALRRSADGPELGAAAASERPLALFGARACDLAAIRVQDRVLIEGDFVDADYAAQREGTFVVAVNCTHPSKTCFCVSMGTGPRAERDYDLALTELFEADRHEFLIRAGSERGQGLLEELSLAAATEAERQRESALLDEARRNMGRTVNEPVLREGLAKNLEHPGWSAVAERCLSCANCTLACPTCFCTTTEDTLDVSGLVAERRRKHDSCFNREHSYMHGGTVRDSVKARYRQWLVHKFSTWYDQFGSSGCVGCGRCITACPVGIDVTEELARIAAG